MKVDEEVAWVWSEKVSAVGVNVIKERAHSCYFISRLSLYVITGALQCRSCLIIP